LTEQRKEIANLVVGIPVDHDPDASAPDSLELQSERGKKISMILELHAPTDRLSMREREEAFAADPMIKTLRELR